MTDLHIFTTGGTIDKVYFDALSEFQVGESPLDAILREANVTLDYQLTSLMRKDSLELTDADRDAIHAAVSDSTSKHVLITHGTDTMAKTAERLIGISDKTIVLTGAMQPARLRSTDAIFNVGFAIAAARAQPAGVYIAMNGHVFAAGHVRKDRTEGRFVSD
ncbi:MAG: asparaginase domain-containing protein [Hyphomonadaceae bacterium]|nr:asparaginase domain-containing protein [Hyphomonadaceae bacterium]